MYNRTPNISPFPPLATTLTSNVRFTIENYDLTGTQYFRLRAVKTKGDTELLITRFKDSSVQVYLPLNT